MAEETSQAAATEQTTQQSEQTGQQTEQTAQTDLSGPAPIIGGEEQTTEASEQRQEGEKTTEEGQKPEQRAPEEYAEFSVPEGVTMDEAQTSEFKSFAKEQDLTQEQAQKVLDFGAGKIKAMMESPYRTWKEMQEQWQAEVKADPEIGGTKLEQSKKDASLVFIPGESNPFISSAEEGAALKQALLTTGAGNNPAVVKVFVKMGRLLSEPGPLTGRPNPPVNLLDNMYGKMTEQLKAQGEQFK
jgi:hypothetical protein